ncbi:gephyrin-like molybdotransferase Glp [Marinobacter sp.]|uniref:molybdopterin molybdotransferase MoeA n=1 Tax=Marinobacter sp. TaxID=50741 RepID=UPI002B270BAB|nr:gephyrin-like molybdotransferase Glp [Marinobacter sp.]
MTKANLTSLDDALTHLLEHATAITETESVTLSGSLGRVLAQDYHVPADVPPADNSAVDGYAIRHGDIHDSEPLNVSDRIPAGAAPQPLQPGTAARIFTGSEIPAGADAVVMQERADRSGDTVIINATVEPGQNIRRRGQDLARGDLALAQGTCIRPQEMGLLASMGVNRVTVFARLKVAILTTGDELVEPGEPLAPGQIYNTNRFTLLGLLAEAGCEVVLCETLKDSREATESALKRASALADLVITSGGVSVGEEDHVRAVLEASGKLSLWRLAIKPGKPLAFGEMNSTPILGLPGNPAAVLVTFMVASMPYIRHCQGRPQVHPLGEQLPASFDIASASIRREFVRARKQISDGAVSVAAYPNQSSGVLSSACWGAGLAVVPENTTVKAGDLITYYPFAELMS